MRFAAIISLPRPLRAFRIVIRPNHRRCLNASGDGDCEANVNNVEALANTILKVGISAFAQINNLEQDDRKQFIATFLENIDAIAQGALAAAPHPGRDAVLCAADRQRRELERGDQLYGAGTEARLNRGAGDAARPTWTSAVVGTYLG
jgi:hypothetical protein